MALNINRNVNDLFYRYKMPRLLVKVEGKGNGIKTVISNMLEISKALNRPATYATKYFGCELGAQTQFDLKNERYIINGEHDSEKLQELLYGFIKKFVLCPKCENPETFFIVKKQKISQSCKTCGNVGIVDQRHKLTTFILRNPPSVTVDQKKISEKKVIPIDERLDTFYNYLLEHKSLDTQLIVNEAERLDIKDKASLLLCRVLFNEPENLLSCIKPNRILLLRFTWNNKKAQRYFLKGLEQLIIENKNVLLPKISHILKAFYDEDIIEERELLHWGKKVSKEILEKAEPFLKWLCDAEEESDTDVTI